MSQIGLVVGATAGLAAAAVYLPFARVARPALTGRVVAALVGSLVVAALLAGTEDAREFFSLRMQGVYVPCGAALVSGAVFGRRLAGYEWHRRR